MCVSHCRQREKKALDQATLQAKRVNANVTIEAQCIFDALSKTLPCTWQDKTIVVLVGVVWSVLISFYSIS